MQVIDDEQKRRFFRDRLDDARVLLENVFLFYLGGKVSRFFEFDLFS